MVQFVSVVRQHLRLQRMPLLVWSGLLALMSLGTMVAAPAATTGNSAEKLMKGLGMEAFGGGGPSMYPHPVDWFVSMKLLEWLPLFVSIYAVLSALSAVSKEEDGHTAEFLLSLPAPRQTVLLGRMTAVFAGMMAISLATLVGLVVGVKAVGMQASELRYAAAMAASFSIATSLGCLGLLVSLVVRPYGRALRYSLGVMTALFLYDMVLRVSSAELSKGILGKLTPFGWIDASRLVRDGVWPVGGMAGALVVSALLLFFAIRIYGKREVL